MKKGGEKMKLKGNLKEFKNIYKLVKEDKYNFTI